MILNQGKVAQWVKALQSESEGSPSNPHWQVQEQGFCYPFTLCANRKGIFLEKFLTAILNGCYCNLSSTFSK